MKRLSLMFLFTIVVLHVAAQAPKSTNVGNAPYSFAALPASMDFDGKAHAPILTTARTRTYATQIFDQAKHGPNFAGHFTVAKWGCGTPCLAFVVVDARTGDVFDPGFTVGCTDKTNTEAAVDFRLRSRLVVATGFSEGFGCRRSYYEWNGRTFTLIYFKPWNYGHRSHRTVQLPHYMTDIPQPIPVQIKPQDAPKTARNIECFRSFTHKSAMIDVVRKCGIPDEHQGSGIYIFLYDMDDGSLVAVGTADLKTLQYMDHIENNRSSSLLR